MAARAEGPPARGRLPRPRLCWRPGPARPAALIGCLAAPARWGPGVEEAAQRLRRQREVSVRPPPPPPRAQPGSAAARVDGMEAGPSGAGTARGPRAPGGECSGAGGVVQRGVVGCSIMQWVGGGVAVQWGGSAVLCSGVEGAMQRGSAV